MKPLTHFKKIRILPLLIAPALVAIVTFASRPALATPQCGFTSTNLLFPGTTMGAYFPSGSNPTPSVQQTYRNGFSLRW